jgi:ATP-binding cassette, subfamily B, multidrug efflux pump
MVLGTYALMLLINAGNIWMPVIIRDILDSGIRPGVREQIVRGAILLVGVALVKGLCTYTQGVWTETASQGVAYDLRNRFHEKLQALSFSFHDESDTGQLLARSVQDVDRIRFLTGRAFLNLIQISVQILGVSVAMFVINPRLALMTYTIMPFLFVGAIRFGTQFRPLSMKIRDREAQLTSRLEQNLRGARIVKAFAREASEIELFDTDNRSLLRTQRAEAKMRSIFLPFMQMLAGVGTLIVLVAGGRMVIRELLSLGELVAFMTYLTQLLIPIRRFGFILSAVAQASASSERIFEILDLKSDVSDAPDAVPLGPVNGAISFHNASFAYGKGRRVLDDVSFRVAPGEKLALLGGTGSGKSSIINLIPRFYDPTEGTIRIDATDIRAVQLRTLRDQIGTVLQDTVLFAATFRENIAFGRPDATQDEIESAARAAHIHDFITSLPDAYDTSVGEQGATLSGGQKQRISIARAILKNPKILILDDATSSVDTETERQIQSSLEELMSGRTSIIIAQRLSTVLSADQVLVLDKGRIAAHASREGGESPHEQLLRTSGVYGEIFAHQLKRSTT